VNSLDLVPAGSLVFVPRDGFAVQRRANDGAPVVEEALRDYLGLDLMERVGARSGLKEKQALALAYRVVTRLSRGSWRIPT
jgi:hypothetical protein